jgi:hypothetical protein
LLSGAADFNAQRFGVPLDGLTATLAAYEAALAQSAVQAGVALGLPGCAALNGGVAPNMERNVV